MTAIGLVVLVLSVSTTVTSGQVRPLRDYLGLIVAMGVPTRWGRQILVHQHTVVIVIATVIGVLIAVPPVLLAAWRLPGFVLSIPWTQLVVLSTAIYLATFAATLPSIRRLRASDRVPGSR